MDGFTRDGLRFDVHDAGPSDGPVVVLLHGFPQDASAFDPVVPHLTAAGLRVLAPDQRGYSPGARPSGRRAYVVRELVADVVALLDAAQVPAAHVVGHDWGGAVAWALAARRPDRVASLTVLSTPHPAASRANLLRGQARRSSYVAGFLVPRVPERRLLADDAAALRDALVRTGLPADRADHYAARLQEPGALTAALAWYRALLVPGGGRTGRVRVPTTYVSGHRDPFFARTSAAATGRWVGDDYAHVVLDAGHWLPETRADDVAAAVLGRVRG